MFGLIGRHSRRYRRRSSCFPLPRSVTSCPCFVTCRQIRRFLFLTPRDNPSSGKQCRCGSTTHLNLRVTHRDCTVNPKRARSDDDDEPKTPFCSRSKTNRSTPAKTASTLVDSDSSDSSDDDNTSGPDVVVSTDTPFSYPVGTKKVAGEIYVFSGRSSSCFSVIFLICRFRYPTMAVKRESIHRVPSRFKVYAYQGRQVPIVPV